MRLYYEVRKRQYDGRLAVWALMDKTVFSEGERNYVYPSRDNPTFKTTAKEWVCVFVGHDMADVDAHIAMGTAPAVMQ